MGFDNFMQIVSLGDNLHGISKPVFWEKIRKMSSVCHLLSESAHRVLAKRSPVLINRPCGNVFCFEIGLCILFKA